MKGRRQPKVIETRCPHCGQALRPVAPVSFVPVKCVTRYVLESMFHVRRMNGGFV